MTLAVLWTAVVLIGGALSWWSVRRVLSRVERVTGAASAIADPEGGQRIPEAGRGRRDRPAGHHPATACSERIAAGTREIRDLSAAVAHDLRSPVTVIRGRLELALTHESDAGLRDAAADAIEGLDRVAAVLEGNLYVAEAEGGVLRPPSRSRSISAPGSGAGSWPSFTTSPRPRPGSTLETDFEDGLRLERGPQPAGTRLLEPASQRPAPRRGRHPPAALHPPGGWTVGLDPR